MTRTLTITAAEWASAKDGTLWIVRDGEPCSKCQNTGTLYTRSGVNDWNAEDCDCPLTPPAEFVQACAPCERCDDTRSLTLFDRHPEPCPDCRVELVGPCPNDTDGDGNCWHCSKPGNHHTLGHAYAVGQPLPIILGWQRPDGDSSGDVLSFWKGHYGPDLVMQRAWNATAIQTQYADRTADLAHYGPPESLVGMWALQLQLTGEPQ